MRCVSRRASPLFFDILVCRVRTCRVANGLPFDPEWPAMGLAKKILSAPDLARWRDELRRAGKKLVVTNGCFDLLHLGHVTYLEQASTGKAMLCWSE